MQPEDIGCSRDLWISGSAVYSSQKDKYCNVIIIYTSYQLLEDWGPSILIGYKETSSLWPLYYPDWSYHGPLRSRIFSPPPSLPHYDTVMYCNEYTATSVFRRYWDWWLLTPLKKIKRLNPPTNKMILGEELQSSIAKKKDTALTYSLPTNHQAT